MKKISVIVIDDSALIRKLLSEIINSQPDMEVVGAAPDPIVAREMIRTLNPDVLTLDVEMPKMDGLEFLEKLMLKGSRNSAGGSSGVSPIGDGRGYDES